MTVRARWGRVAALTLLLALTAGCREEAEEQAPRSRPAEAVAMDEEPAPEEAQAPGRVHEGTGQMPAAQGQMPNDAAHAGLRNQRPGLGRAELPAGHPPVEKVDDTVMRAKAPSMETGKELPLLQKGAGSVSELNERLAPMADEDVKRELERAFRLVFTLDRKKRDAKKAEELLKGLPREGEVGATVQRILAYVRVSRGFDAKAALEHYKRAVELDADYGEAHYALSFMHVMDDREAGKKHYDIARKLGVPDNSNLARYYGEGAKAAAPAGGHGGAPAGAPEGGEGEGDEGAH